MTNHVPSFEVSYDKIPQPQEVSIRNTFSLDLWMLGLR